MTDRELMQQALDVIEAAIKAGDWKVDGACDPDYVLEALRARLAQPEPEPIAWHEPGAYSNVTTYKDWAKENGWLPLYTAPPQREWKGLTKEEARELCVANVPYVVDMVAALEARLKEKNT